MSIHSQPSFHFCLLYKIEKVVHTREKRERKRGTGNNGNELKVAYMNINGLISGLDELNDYLKKSMPDVMGIVETKLNGQIIPSNIGNESYKAWSRNRKVKQGEGVMLLIKEGVKV